MKSLEDMPGLGPASARQLAAVGIDTPEKLRDVGPVAAFLRLREQGGKPSLNFLYAMVGAIEGRHWAEVAREERGRLLLELNGYAELERLLDEEGG